MYDTDGGRPVPPELQAVAGEFEEILPGGLYAKDEADRTDVYLKTSDSKTGSMELIIVTGQGTFALVDLPPGEIAKLGRWLASAAMDRKRQWEASKA